jgi:hypothetical protein
MPLEISNPGLLWTVVSLTAVWETAWKGIALWRAARNRRLAWYVCILVFNTAGILPIVYVFAFGRRSSTRAVA